MKHIKDWLDKQIHEMECRFDTKKESLGVVSLGADYYDLGRASSADNILFEDNVTDVYEDGFYYGTLFGEYIKLKELRHKLDGIDYNLED